MHRAHWLILLVGFSLSLLTAANARADWLERKWTNTEGKSITARFIRSTPTMALLNQDGKVIRVPLGQLTQADRDWIGAAEELKKMREWRLLDGTSHRARLQDIEGDMLTLEVRSETIQLTVAQLNADDQTLVAKVSVVAGPSGITSPAPAGGTTSRKWTDKNGKTIEAEFRGVEGDKVVLLFRNKEHRVPISDLSEGDQQFVQSQQQAQQEGIAIAQGETPSSRSSEEMAQDERIAELLRKRRELAERLAQNPPPTPPADEQPAPSGPSYEPTFPEPRYPAAASEDPGRPSWAGGHRPRSQQNWDDEHDQSNYYSQPVRQQVFICARCRHENPAANFKAGDKCRGCGKQIDVIRNADGSTHSSSAAYSGRKIGRIVGGVAALIGLLFGAMKKMMG